MKSSDVIEFPYPLFTLDGIFWILNAYGFLLCVCVFVPFLVYLCQEL